jgi:hypothetical protein
MSITDQIIKKTADKFSDYSKRTLMETYNAMYTNATSGTITYGDGTLFTWQGTSALDIQYTNTNTIYRNIITSATDWREIKSRYLMAIQSMEIDGTFFDDSFEDSNVNRTRRPLTADMSFLDYCDKQIQKEDLRASGTYIGVYAYV